MEEEVQPQEGELWIGDDGFSYILIRIAGKPSAQKCLMQQWRSWSGGQWSRPSSRYKSILLFRIHNGAEPKKIAELMVSAANERDQRKRAADVACRDAMRKIAAA